MVKKNVLWILLDLIFLIVFNSIFFLAGGSEHPASVWISYGFIHFSYLMILITPFLIRKSSSSFTFGASIYSVSSVYFFVEFIAGLVFIFVRAESINFTLLTQIVIAGLYLIILFANLIANEHTADADERKEAELVYIRDAASRVKILIGKISDKKADKAVEKAYDFLHSSPTKSSDIVYSIETQVMNKVSLLEDAVSSSDAASAITLSAEIISLMEERNRKLRIARK